MVTEFRGLYRDIIKIDLVREVKRGYREISFLL